MLVGGPVGVVALVSRGAAVIGTFGVSLVMSQEYLPSRVGLASGLSIGLAIGLGGVAAVALGAIADSVDLETAVLATALGPTLAHPRAPPPGPPPRPSAGAGARPRSPLMPQTAREFFEDLQARRRPLARRRPDGSYRFDVDGTGSWRVDVETAPSL